MRLPRKTMYAAAEAVLRRHMDDGESDRAIMRQMFSRTELLTSTPHVTAPTTEAHPEMASLCVGWICTTS